MSKMREYVFYKCRDCEIDFLLAKVGSGKTSKYCPKCGDNIFTEKVTEFWLERPFQYKKKWTAEEDELVRNCKTAGYTHQQIADSLDGRTMVAVRQRWQELRKKKALEESK